MTATAYRDYYKILGVERNVTDKEIKAAYRKMARKYHPDLHAGSAKKEAEDKFKEINEAYEVLSDPEKRSKYDTLGTEWNHGQEWQPPPGMDGFQFYTWNGTDIGDLGGSGFSDFFDILFGQKGFSRSPAGAAGGFYQPRSARGQDAESELELTLEEAYRGGEKALQLNSHDICPACHGSGHLTDRLCPTCSGMGSKKTVKTLTVKIPAGIQEGSRIRLKNQGSEGIAGGEKGDLYLLVKFKPHPTYTLNGHDLETRILIRPEQAVLGDKATVPTLDGEVLLTIPPMTRNGQKLRLRGKGWPHKNGSRGDEYVQVIIDIPDNLRREEKELYQKLAHMR